MIIKLKNIQEFFVLIYDYSPFQNFIPMVFSVDKLVSKNKAQTKSILTCLYFYLVLFFFETFFLIVRLTGSIRRKWWYPLKTPDHISVFGVLFCAGCYNLLTSSGITKLGSEIDDFGPECQENSDSIKMSCLSYKILNCWNWFTSLCLGNAKFQSPFLTLVSPKTKSPFCKYIFRK